MIGSFGPVVFEVSESKVYTFDEFKRQTQAKFGTHELLGKKPKLEFIAPGLDSISFQIVLNASLGIDIAAELVKLRDIVNNGQYHPLLIGDDSIGNFVIESLSESWRNISNLGRPQVVALDISLKEYYVESTTTKAMKESLAKKKVNPDKLTQLANKIRPAAQKINLTVKHINAIAQVGLSVSRSVAMSSRGLNGLLEGIGSIAGLSNSQISSFKQLGLNVNTITQTIKSNPILAVTGVLDAINSTGIKYQSTAVSNIFGTLHKGFIIPLAKNSSTLKSLI